MVASNWSGNWTYAADRLVAPRTMAELQELVATASRVKPLGTRHCFNDIADCPGGVQIDLAGLDTPIEIDAEASTVTVGAAARYGDFAKTLHAAGFALPNLASLPHCTVAGSVATATHGAGVRHRSLASAVTAVELVSADGQRHTYSRDKDPDVFPGLVVNLGALGVLTRLTLDLVPAFDVRQDVFDDLPWDAVFEHFDEIQAAGYSVSMFTDWREPRLTQLWIKSLTEDGPPAIEGEPWFTATPAPSARNPVPGLPADNSTAQLGEPGPWFERLPHFRPEFTPSAGDELQSEYLVPRQHALPAFEALRGLGERLAPMLLVSEIRSIAADDLWLSPFHGGDRVGLHFTWRGDQREVEALLPVIEERLEPFGLRAHWGKLFHRGSMASCYPKMPEFRALAERLDPEGKFRSPFVRRHVFAAPAA